MRYISVWLGLIILTVAIAVACATPEPTIEEIEVTVGVTKIVPQTVEVQQTVEIPVTRITTRLVVATPEPTATLRPTATRTSPSTSIIKKSRSGICHPPGGTYYSRTLNYTPYATMAECLASGGRRPLR